MTDVVDAELEDKLWGHLRPKVLATLPDKTRELLAIIENYAGLEVTFRDMKLLSEAGAPSHMTAHEALFCNEHRAYISIPNPSEINPNAVLHELLHLHRYWVEGAAQLDAAHDIGSNVELMANIDNTLEHLVIVPLEQQYGYDPSNFWAASVIAAFEGHPWRHQSEEWIRGACITGWLSASLTNDARAREIIKSQIEALGLLSACERALASIVRAKASKPRMVKAALTAMKIPARSAVLVKLDIRNHTSRRMAVPAL